MIKHGTPEYRQLGERLAETMNREKGRILAALGGRTDIADIHARFAEEGAELVIEFEDGSSVAVAFDIPPAPEALN